MGRFVQYLVIIFITSLSSAYGTAWSTGGGSGEVQSKSQNGNYRRQEAPQRGQVTPEWIYNYPYAEADSYVLKIQLAVKSDSEPQLVEVFVNSQDNSDIGSYVELLPYLDSNQLDDFSSSGILPDETPQILWGYEGQGNYCFEGDSSVIQNPTRIDSDEGQDCPVELWGVYVDLRIYRLHALNEGITGFPAEIEIYLEGQLGDEYIYSAIVEDRGGVQVGNPTSGSALDLGTTETKSTPAFNSTSSSAGCSAQASKGFVGLLILLLSLMTALVLVRTGRQG